MEDTNGKIETLQEGTAQKLIDGFNSLAKASNELGRLYCERLSSMLQWQIEYIRQDLLLKSCTYQAKMLTSTFITRWYWRRKYRKDNAKYEDFCKRMNIKL